MDDNTKFTYVDYSLTPQDISYALTNGFKVTTELKQHGICRILALSVMPSVYYILDLETKSGTKLRMQVPMTNNTIIFANINPKDNEQHSDNQSASGDSDEEGNVRSDAGERGESGETVL